MNPDKLFVDLGVEKSEGISPVPGGWEGLDSESAKRIEKFR
jgi:hypothetical protein